MRSHRGDQPELAEVTRRRLELLQRELAEVQPEQPRGSGPAGAPPPPQHPSVPEAPGVPDPRRLPVPGRHARRAGRPAAPGERAPVAPPPSRLGALVRGWGAPASLRASHAAVVAVLVALAALLTAWWVLRADGAQPVVLSSGRTASGSESGTAPGGATPSPLVTPTAIPGGSGVTSGSPAAGATATGAAAGATAAPLVVDVAGRVRHPGIVTLPPGARVIDALRAAGGARPKVDLSTLNLARVLVDGEQLLVGVRGPHGVAASALSAPSAAAVSPSGPAALVNLNTADSAQLDTLPGVGPVTAAAILQWRTEHGAFSSVDELLEVSGIGEATLADLAPFVTV